ncbi:STAS domain-containing protein [Niallia sp. NCCP-28]|uniref:STAS domain-containing protein n=1 Tax=Niallia sp. NCCP-28 TaxID=2934712 RepID=UPI00208073F7|nr:STAS domain-containing protein [Niallia sp. NCCP-28]GKU83686.1 RsbT co-antagonist protein RsbRC [Niallia sp. NCCP-28]
MPLMNTSLYNYILENSASISERWFSLKEGENGSIYSSTVSPYVKELLEKQHTFTIQTVMSAFLDDQQIFASNLSKWAIEVAQSRVDLGTPTHEVLQALSITRQIIWEHIEQYIKEHGDIPTEVILNWITIFQQAFDTLNNKFASLYHEFTIKQLNEQQKIILALSNPIIPLIANTGVLPLVGDIDSSRSKSIIEEVPERCLKEKINHLYIDLSGLSTFDAKTLDELIKLIHVLALIGIDTTISGMSPEMAKLAGVSSSNLSKVNTYSSLRQAFSKGKIKLIQE